MSKINLVVLGVITGVNRVDDEHVKVTVTLCDANNGLTDMSYDLIEEQSEDWVVGESISINLQLPQTTISETTEDDIVAVAFPEVVPDETEHVTIHGVVLAVMEQTADQSQILVAVNLCDDELVSQKWIIRIARANIRVGDAIMAEVPVGEDVDPDNVVVECFMVAGPEEPEDDAQEEHVPAPDGGDTPAPVEEQKIESAPVPAPDGGDTPAPVEEQKTEPAPDGGDTPAPVEEQKIESAPVPAPDGGDTPAPAPAPGNDEEEK